jgi:NhaP-type Na+/H+ or K+/H+ antiporter
MAFSLNSIVFLLIGFEVSFGSLVASWPEVTVAFAATLAARTGVVAGVTLLLRRTAERIPGRWSLVLTWGGLRGALSMVLALAVAPEFSGGSLLITMTFGVVLASLLIQGLSMFGVTIPGRVGPVDMSFITEHAATIFMVNRQTARWDTDDDRLGWYAQVWQGLTASPANLVWGSGFGEPLIDFASTRGAAAGVVVRQPHNSSLSVLARLGLTGLAVWLLFHFFVLRSFLRGLQARSSLDDLSADLLLWLLFLYLLFMITTSVQPLLEFSHGAVPFFFLMGFALGMR